MNHVFTPFTAPAALTAAPTVANVPPAVRSGAWLLAPGRAITLKADGPSVLRVRQGRVWITRDATAQGASADLVIGPGESLVLARGDRLVMEPWDGNGATWTWDQI